MSITEEVNEWFLQTLGLDDDMIKSSFEDGYKSDPLSSWISLMIGSGSDKVLGLSALTRSLRNWMKFLRSPRSYDWINHQYKVQEF